jgi:hypothetical protein
LEREDFTLAIGAYALTIPSGRFQRTAPGHWVFQGSIGGVGVDATVHAATSGEYEFETVLNAVDLRGSTFPLPVALTIGKDDGSLTLDHGKAQISNGHPDDND